MNICEYCGKEHDATYGAGRFCSEKCARGFASKEKREEINRKVSQALKGRASPLKGRMKIGSIRWRRKLGSDIKRERINQFTKEQLQEAAKNSSSYRGVLRYLGVPARSGGRLTRIGERLKSEGIDIGHFRHNGANYGVNHRGGWAKLSAKDILVYHRSKFKEQPARLKKALLEIGRKYECIKCGLKEWEGKSLVLDVHHYNGDSLDNRPENIDFMCPNCHSQTDNYGAKNIGNGKR